MSDKKTIVVSHSVDSINTQIYALQYIGVAAECIHSQKNRQDNINAWKKFVSPNGKILYMSPERLMTERMLDTLQKHNIGMIVINEAHCISKWGSSFRPDYESLSRLKSVFPQAMICGFTTTTDMATRNDIAEKLFSGQGKIVGKGFDLPNLSLSVHLKKDYKESLLSYIKDRPNQSGIVYCLSHKNTEQISDYLKNNGITALSYHADQSESERTAHQNLFMRESGGVMVATIGSNMDIDKSDIRFVIHANLPSSMEAFYQEIRRVDQADTVLFYNWQDITHHRRRIFAQNIPNVVKIAEYSHLQSLIGYAESAQCRRKILLAYFDDTVTNCGNCDNCVSPPKLQDCTEYAKHVLTAVQQTREYFGASYIIDVIRGDETQNIRDFHMNLPCFGIGKQNSKWLYQIVIRQLIANGYLQIDFNKFGAMHLHSSSQNLLNGTEMFTGILPTAKSNTVKIQKTDVTQSVMNESSNTPLPTNDLDTQDADTNNLDDLQTESIEEGMTFNIRNTGALQNYVPIADLAETYFNSIFNSKDNIFYYERRRNI